MAHGTPTAPSGIEAFYTRIRHGHPPTPEQLADLTRRYQAIGGTSPLAQHTADQVAGLAGALEASSPGHFDVRYGSKFEPPLLEDAAAAFREEGFTRVVGLVLAPHSSTMSTDQYMERARVALGEAVRVRHCRRMVSHTGFLRAHRSARQRRDGDHTALALRHHRSSL